MSRVKVLVRVLAVIAALTTGALMPPELALAAVHCSLACPGAPWGTGCVCDSSCPCCTPGAITTCRVCYLIC